MYDENKLVINWLNLNLSLAPIYRWPGLEDWVGFNINYNVYIRYQLVFRLCFYLSLTLITQLPERARGVLR
jgi:hypothetical protein